MAVGRSIDLYLGRAQARLRQLVDGAGADDEAVLQTWLERHPCFVPGAYGQDGGSGWPPWPSAVITQPPLSGLVGHIPDFLWFAVDSRYLTAVCVEIERPNKRLFTVAGTPYADLVQARSQIVNWRTWFARPENQLKMLEEYLVPVDFRRREFRQHYILVIGRRAEFEANPELVRRRANSNDSINEMTWDRLIEGVNPKGIQLACVRASNSGGGFDTVALTPFWDPESAGREALSCMGGLEEAIQDSEISDEQKQAYLQYLRSDEVSVGQRTLRYRPPRRKQ